MRFVSINFRFTKMHHPTSFYTKPNPRENGLFASEWEVGDKKGSSVKCVDGYHVMHIVLM